MNTHGHEDVAKAAGLPLLEEVLGKDKRSLKALYLGNWLRDVSQTIDPVAYWVRQNKIKTGIDTKIDKIAEAIDNIIEEILDTTYESFDIRPGSSIDHWLKSLKPELNPYAEDAKESIHKDIDFLFAGQTNERDSTFAKFMRDSFLVIGYYKFVHPNALNQQPRMNFECFMRVFGRPNDTRGSSGNTPANDRPGAYTQYYPHEHLDRPECFPPKDPPVYAPGRQGKKKEDQFQIAQGKRSGMRSPRSSRYGEEIEPDLYSYLRDDIEMIAGLLAEVELEFEQVFAKGIRDEDPKWYITLAKLGHALHQVEDFFSHSNWVELAALRLGDGFLSKAIHRETCERASSIFDRRLKRHVTEALDDLHEHQDELWVVTGYFDTQDLLISLAHFSEELWGGHVPDPCAAGYDLFKVAQEAIQQPKPKTVLFEAQKTMQFTLDFLTNPKRALEDSENYIAQKLKNKFEPDLEKLQQPGISKEVAEYVLREFKTANGEIPGEIQRAFVNVIIEGSRVEAGWSIYKSIREISEFIAHPFGYLLNWLPDYLKQKVVDALKFYAKERFYDYLGANRIGCHSLLSKDHGYEPFYKYQKECATAVHWYIVNTLLRHWKSKNSTGHVDWLALLEYFLCNPQVPQDISCKEVRICIPVTLIHTVARHEQLKARNPLHSLEHRFKRTAFNPSTFTWRTIADANFGTTDLTEEQTQEVINKALRSNPRAGYAVTPPNYAFMPGWRILIPEQSAEELFRIPAENDSTWFQEVMEKGWKVFTGYEDPENEISVPPLKPHSLKMISSDQLKQLIDNGKKLRRIAREAYRPGAKSQCP